MAWNSQYKHSKFLYKNSFIVRLDSKYKICSQINGSYFILPTRFDSMKELEYFLMIDKKWVRDLIGVNGSFMLKDVTIVVSNIVEEYPEMLI